MWERDLPREKPRFYRRRWFAVPAIICAALLVFGIITGLLGIAYLESETKKYDLSLLDEMESASRIFDRTGKPLGQIFIQNRDTIPMAEIAPEMTSAVVAAEDKRFFSHNGVDYVGAMRALLANFRASRTREGASTVTQQLARNTFGMFDRTYDRKLREMFLARQIEKRVRSKEKIMELYLNRVYFGQGFFGVQAAARGYFGKSARQLTLGECATLAGLLKSPNRLSPWSNRRACIAQRDFVLGRMEELELITPQQHAEAVAKDLIVKNRGPLSRESYAMDMVRQKVVSLVGRENAFSDGYRIYTTIDEELQKTAVAALQRKVSEIEQRGDFKQQTYARYTAMTRTRRESDNALPTPEYLQGAVVALDNASGGILAIVGGRDFGQSEFNRAVQATRPAGTAFTPFVYAAAYEKGIFPGALVEDGVMDNRQVMIGGSTGILGEWGPERVDNQYEGPISANYALVKGKNAATVRLGMRAGLPAVTRLAREAGIKSEMWNFPKTYLGSSGVTPMELTLAYTTFPNGGVRPAEPFIVTRVESNDGRVIFREKPAEHRAMESATAYQVHTALAEVLDVGTGDQAYAQYGLKKFPLGGKTGTSYGFTDAWFVGYSSAVTCGVWVGFDKPAEIYRGAFSNQIALPIWVDVMNASFATHPAREIQPPRGLERYEVCSASGQLATDECVEPGPGGRPRRTTYSVQATAKQAPKQPCQVHGAGGGPVALQQLEPGEAPRATLAVDVESIKPVMMKAPTVIGEVDPYGAVKPTAVLAARRADTGALPPGGDGEEAPPPPAAEPEVRRAEAVLPGEQPATDSTIMIKPPEPMDF